MYANRKIEFADPDPDSLPEVTASPVNPGSRKVLTMPSGRELTFDVDAPPETPAESRKRTIALRDAVGLALVVIGGIGAPVAAGLLWGVSGAVLAASVVLFVLGIAIGLSE